jgi:hypothetical protein
MVLVAAAVQVVLVVKLPPQQMVPLVVLEDRVV